jgi:paraquat-inducible protein B
MDNNYQLELINTTKVAIGESFLPSTIDSIDAFTQELSNYINHLLNTDFEKVVSLLYRIDVDENKIKNLLENTTNSSFTIAQAIIERQLQKIKSRQKYRRDNNFSEEEKW